MDFRGISFSSRFSESINPTFPNDCSQRCFFKKSLFVFQVFKLYIRHAIIYFPSETKAIRTHIAPLTSPNSNCPSFIDLQVYHVGGVGRAVDSLVRLGTMMSPGLFNSKLKVLRK